MKTETTQGDITIIQERKIVAWNRVKEAEMMMCLFWLFLKWELQGFPIN